MADITVSADIDTFMQAADAAAARAVLGAGVGDALTSGKLSQFAATSSAELRGVVSDETGTGALVFAGGNIAAATATTASAGDSSTKVATTAFVIGSVGTTVQDSFTGDAVTVAFTLSSAPVSNLAVVTVNGLVQTKTTDYSISSTTLTFVAAPANAAAIQVYYGSPPAGGGGSGTVTSVAISVPTFLSVAGSPVTSSGTLAVTLSGTALPVANGGTGITAFGTGIATALGVNVGSAGAPVVLNGALGTPSSGTLTNATGLPASGLAAGVLGANITFGENTSLILDAALSADGKYCGITEAGTAGATLAFGDIVYLAVADSRWELIDADAEATAGPVKVAVCVLAAAADGDPTTLLLWGKVRADAAFPTFTVGSPVYLSTTAGDLQVAQPSGTDDVIRVAGYGNTADELFFCPSNDYATHT